jgi:succinylglutamic semialdehyde dehydrogenase
MADGVYIDGKWRAGSGAAFSKTCPATGELVWEGSSADGRDVAEAVISARKAFAGWSRTSQAERTAVMERYAEELGKLAGAIAETISREMGKALWDAEGEAATMKAKIAVSIAAQKERAGEKTESAAFGASRLTHRPHGVLAVFGPFNFPGHLPNGHIVPALLAGNTCVFKPSELAPGVAAQMAACLESAGLPPGCVNIVHGGRETGGALIDQDINGLLFTGSAATGVFFHRHFAGRPDVILALEMGGNNPLIIWEPADVDAAADIAAQSAFLTTVFLRPADHSSGGVVWRRSGRGDRGKGAGPENRGVERAGYLHGPAGFGARAATGDCLSERHPRTRRKGAVASFRHGARRRICEPRRGGRDRRRRCAGRGIVRAADADHPGKDL